MALRKAFPIRQTTGPGLFWQDLNAGGAADERRVGQLFHARYSGCVFRTLNVIDEANRGAPRIVIAASMSAARVVEFLPRMIDLHGRPRAIRCNSGPELTSQAFSDWCKAQDIELRFIQPGKPGQNAPIEGFNQTYREGVLSGYLLDSTDQVREIAAEWLKVCDKTRRHDALASLPPARNHVRLLAGETPI